MQRIGQIYQDVYLYKLKTINFISDIIKIEKDRELNFLLNGIFDIEAIIIKRLIF